MSRSPVPAETSEQRERRQLERRRRAELSMATVQTAARIHVGRQLKAQGIFIGSVDTQARAHTGQFARRALITRGITTSASLAIGAAVLGYGALSVAGAGIPAVVVAVAGIATGIGVLAGRTARIAKRKKEEQIKDLAHQIHAAAHDLEQRHVHRTLVEKTDQLRLSSTNLLKYSSRALDLSSIGLSAASASTDLILGIPLIGGAFSVIASIADSVSHQKRKKSLKDILADDSVRYVYAASRLNEALHHKVKGIISRVLSDKDLVKFVELANSKDNTKYGKQIVFHTYKAIFSLLDSGNFDITKKEDEDRVVKSLTDSLKSFAKPEDKKGFVAAIKGFVFGQSTIDNDNTRNKLRHIDSSDPKKARKGIPGGRFTNQKSMSVPDAMIVFEKEIQMNTMQALNQGNWQKAEKAAQEVFQSLNLDPKHNDTNRSAFFYTQRTIAQQLYRNGQQPVDKKKSDDEILEVSKKVAVRSLSPRVDGKSLNKPLIFAEHPTPDYDRRGSFDRLVNWFSKDPNDRGELGVRRRFYNYHLEKVAEEMSRGTQREVGIMVNGDALQEKKEQMMDKKAVRTAVEDIKEERGRAEAFIQLRKRKREGSVLSESERNLLQEMSEEKKEEEKGSKTKDRKSGSSSWLSRKELEEKLEERIKICEVVLQNSGLSPDLYRAIGVKSGKDQREQVVDKKRHFQEKLDKLKSDKGLSSAERVLLGAELVGGRDRPRGG